MHCTDSLCARSPSPCTSAQVFGPGLCTSSSCCECESPNSMHHVAFLSSLFHFHSLEATFGKTVAVTGSFPACAVIQGCPDSSAAFVWRDVLSLATWEY